MLLIRRKIIIKDITGKRSGKLVAIERLEKGSSGYYWLCKCDCGNTHKVAIGHFNKGSIRSCGCLKLESLTTHGMTKTTTYTSYRKMIDRCKSKEYSDFYKDVTICDRWLESFENFFEDMGERPEGMTLNRIHGAKMYSKETCEWATLSVQSYDQKRSKVNTSGRTGIQFFPKKGLWLSRIKVNRKTIRLYYGPSYEEAVKAREQAELKYFGFIKE